MAPRRFNVGCHRIGGKLSTSDRIQIQETLIGRIASPLQVREHTLEVVRSFRTGVLHAVHPSGHLCIEPVQRIDSFVDVAFDCDHQRVLLGPSLFIGKVNGWRRGWRGLNSGNVLSLDHIPPVPMFQNRPPARRPPIAPKRSVLMLWIREDRGGVSSRRHETFRRCV